MKIIVARTAGFCWGVRRAMDAVLDASNRAAAPVQTLGPLIHNPQAMELLARRGVSVVQKPEEIQGGTVLVRAHGIPLQELRALKERQTQGELSLINATCPEVAKVHGKIKKYSSKGYFTIILGVHGHAEAVAHLSFAQAGAVIVSTLAEAQTLADDLLGKCLIIAQTTFDVRDFQEISQYLASRSQDCIIENTICRDTWTRQQEVEIMAQTVDLVIVVGGKNSSNTRHLAERVQKHGKPVQLVETAQELDLSLLTGLEALGVTAGASTPTWMVDEVVEALERQRGGPSRWQRFIQAAFGTSGVAALGAAWMTWGVHHWLKLPVNALFPAITALYVLAMYLLNPYIDPMSLSHKDPVQRRFLTNHRSLLLWIGASALALALALSAWIGWRALIPVLLASVFGLTYSLSLSLGKRTFSLKSIPGSKDVLVALALAIVAVGMPLWHHGQFNGLRALGALGLVGILALTRSVLLDIRELQKDQILGKETIPILLGKEGAKHLLLGLLGVQLILTLSLAATKAEGVHIPEVLVLGACALFPMIYLWLHHERFQVGKPPQVLNPDLTFYMAGLLSLV